jgi:flavorubredoxin
MALVTEIAADVYRISCWFPEFNLQFNHFLVKDEEPLLFHTGLKRFFPEIVEAVGKILPPERLRWISFSHFESDECGSLNEWLQMAPRAQAVSGFIGANVNLADYAIRAPHCLMPGETLATGNHRYRFCPTPHLPHGWDAGVLFEEEQHTLFVSDLFHQDGAVEPLTASDVLGRVRATLTAYQQGPLANYVPWNHRSEGILHSLSDLAPATLAVMHGSSFNGNCTAALRDLAVVMKDVLGAESPQSAVA